MAISTLDLLPELQAHLHLDDTILDIPPQTLSLLSTSSLSWEMLQQSTAWATC